MNTLKILVLSLIIVLFISCGDNDDINIGENDFLIFGHFYGECFGSEECVETFKLTDEELFEDSNDNYLGTEPFNFTVLENSKFEEVKNLIDFFPLELLDENETIIGCPDCADQGGILVQYSANGNVDSWRIDQYKEDIPNYLHTFIDKVNEKIALINN